MALASITAAALLCGCDNQTKSDTAKIEALAHKIDVVYSNSILLFSNQMDLASEIISVKRDMGQMNYYYFTNSHQDALFYYTNTMHVLLLLDKKLDLQFKVAEAQSQADKESIQDTINTETKRVVSGNEKILEMKVNSAVLDIKSDNIPMGTDLKLIKIKLDIPY